MSVWEGHEGGGALNGVENDSAMSGLSSYHRVSHWPKVDSPRWIPKEKCT